MPSLALRLTVVVGTVVPIAWLWAAVDVPWASRALLTITGVLAALPALRGGGPWWWRCAIALVVCACAGAATALPSETLLQQLSAQGRGQAPLVVARAALFCGGALLLPLVPPRRRALGVALLALTLVGSWAAQAGLAMLAASWCFVASAARGPRGSATHCDRVLAMLAGAAGVLVGVLGALPRSSPPVPRTDPELALHFQAMDNPWRALPHARAWAAAEPGPAMGALCLARVAARLGDDDEARALFRRVADGADPDARVHARAGLAELGP
ncbi:MAG: hypothetical protein IT382_15320 [Deltaproteobacteria bacterium]|nr:hypothetical protein [Deltaproteobacteria bacterium]